MNEYELTGIKDQVAEEYSHEAFNHGYYNLGHRGGFPRYEYEDMAQQDQLGLKFDWCRNVDHESALFIGCARGFEVAYWKSKGKAASGVDVSDWAINNVINPAKGFCFKNDYLETVPDSSFDLVAAFDVLSLIPDVELFPIVAHMVRIAKNGITMRCIVKNWRNLDALVDGQDGVKFRYKQLHEWDRMFSESGKFRLEFCRMHFQYEIDFAWSVKPEG